MLEVFCQGVKTRMDRAGFSWSTLVVTLLPVVIDVIQNCFNKPSDLQAFAEGRRGPLQMAGLRNRCRRIVQEQGVRGWVRVSNAAADLQEAIIDELNQVAANAATASGPGIWQDAFDEALAS